MSLLNLSGKNNSEDESEESSSPKSEREIHHQIKELLDREFHVVQNGLDPAEVMGFLETIAGTSEAGLKQLEHLASLHRRSAAMEAMVAETHQTIAHVKEQAKQEAEAQRAQVIEEAACKAEEIKEQAKQETEAQRAQVIEEAERKAEEIKEQAKQEIEAQRAQVIEEAERKAEEIKEQIKQEIEAQRTQVIEEAERKAEEIKEQIKQEAEPLKQNIHNVLDAIYRDLNSRYEQFGKDLSASKLTATHTAPDAAEQETAPATEEVVNVEVQAAVPKEDNSGMYSGEVTLSIPPGAEPAWMTQLRQRLSSIPGIRTRLEARTNTNRSIMILSLDKPVKLTSVLLEMPKVERVIEGDQEVAESAEDLVEIFGQRLPAELQHKMLTVVLREDTTG